MSINSIPAAFQLNMKKLSVLNLYFRISPQIFVKTQKGPNSILGARRKLHKNLKSKISCQAPFKLFISYQEYLLRHLRTDITQADPDRSRLRIVKSKQSGILATNNQYLNISAVTPILTDIKSYLLSVKGTVTPDYIGLKLLCLEQFCGVGAELNCLPETTLQIAAPDPFPTPAPFCLTTDLKKLYKKIIVAWSFCKYLGTI